MKTSDAYFTKAVASSISIAQVLRLLGRAYAGSNYTYVHKNVARLKLNTAHWKGLAHGTTRQPKIPWSDVLVKDSPYHMTTLRRRALINEGLLKNKCAICGQLPFWNGLPLTLRLDPENGKRRDHRISNLRYVWPNWDSQLPTFCGRNTRFRSSGAEQRSLKTPVVGSNPTGSATLCQR